MHAARPRRGERGCPGCGSLSRVGSRFAQFPSVVGVFLRYGGLRRLGPRCWWEFVDRLVDRQEHLRHALDSGDCCGRFDLGGVCAAVGIAAYRPVCRSLSGWSGSPSPLSRRSACSTWPPKARSAMGASASTTSVRASGVWAHHGSAVAMINQLKTADRTGVDGSGVEREGVRRGESPVIVLLFGGVLT